MGSVSKKVAQTIAQTKQSILIGGEEYMYPPLNCATLALVGNYISDKTENFNQNSETVVSDILALAKDNHSLEEVLACLILGAESIYNEMPHIEQIDTEIIEHIEETKYLLGFIPYIVKTPKKTIKKQDIIIGTEFLYLIKKFSFTPIQDVVTAITTILNEGQATAFFLQGLIFLRTISWTKPTLIESEIEMKTEKINRIVHGD